MAVDLDQFYDMFADWAMGHGGASAAADRFLSVGVIDESQAALLVKRFQERVQKVMQGGPIIKPKHEDSWYPGALETDQCWGAFRQQLIEKGRESQIDALNEASDTIVRLTPDPSGEPRSARGLVVGHIQSGKTTNFTAVAAKLADRKYRMVIVLAGIHNSLRKQTQDRLIKDLTAKVPGRWFTITGVDGDFDLTRLGDDSKKPGKQDAVAYLSAHGQTSLLVVKKNAAVLRKLHLWLNKPSARDVLQTAQVLVIDDEADQASVETNTINPLIRQILGLFPRGTYIGYTATPFANVFIDPSDSDDLYPRDFIYPLPQPENYFGSSTLFGRDVPDLDKDDEQGLDMIRIIPDEDEFLLRPRGRADLDDFYPVVTDELRSAIRWFVLATAARWRRGDRGDSSMLIHTSFQTSVHEKFAPVIDAELKRLLASLMSNDPAVLDALHHLWTSEISRVPAEQFKLTPLTFDEIRPFLRAVVDDCRIIIDNSKSEARLQYDEDESYTVIAIGGNTLSRGITLEGLVSSVFLRPTNTYDTLLQMGRWFGFRVGYEDLPRIWMTDDLRRAFRHLALVEHEMRQDMAVYELQGITPMEAAVRIRTHPALRVTAKMGAARPNRISYSGARLQTRFYRRWNEPWLANNWRAGERLVAAAMRHSQPEPLANGGVVLRNVKVNDVRSFLEEYDIVPDQADMSTEQLLQYIEHQNGLDDPKLVRWNVAVVGGSGEDVRLAGLAVPSSIRAPYKDSGEVADIKTLMSKVDLVVDVEGLSSTEARRMPEAELKERRIEAPELRGKGLLILYPLDRIGKPHSDRSAGVREPMNASSNPLGLALVFPKTSYSDSERDAVQMTHVAVDLATFPEEVDTDAEVYGTDR
ncbi:Z1 domain-containing protein [Mycobacterium sp. UM_Kg1]|uniref:Z1 domain-containing protein n=1 Tax=Mycobacterium sp. UM_Kg1 TaxID=1545691 RepID=UPI00061B57EC|nr:Z1 domain-containing protein [Mycobacterium sp. UM_Kg1]